jgi:hypothetical protein
VRTALLSVAVGLVGAVGVAASGWALQASALPPPKPAARIAADTSAWFHDYRLVVDVFHVDHRRVKGACLRGWFRRPDGPKVRASLLSLRFGPVLLLSAGRRVSRVGGRRNRRLPARLLASVGCSGKLAPRLAGVAQSGADYTAARSYAANQPAVRLKLERVRDERLTLYVSPRTYQPLVAIGDAHGREATARLYLTRVTRALLARFHFPTEAEPRPKR